MDFIEKRIAESIAVKNRILNNREILCQIRKASEVIKAALESGGKVMFCGNGGSASDALHLTGEIVGRFQKERKAFAALCLNADVTTMTAVANDYGYEYVFSRAIEGMGKPGDILVGITTSGKSKNVYAAIAKAKEMGIATIALLGKDGGIIKDLADISIIVPENNTARIQESHILIGHIMCEFVEEDY